MASQQKRKINSEGRIFNPDWTNKYFFIEFKNKYFCLACRDTVSVAKEYNMRRHFETKHSCLSELDENQKNLKINQLRKNLTGEQSMFQNFSRRADTGTLISYKISREIAATGRPFTDGDFVKKCLLIAINDICPEKKQAFENISLSRMTMQRRISDISSDLYDQLKQTSATFRYFSIALDESTDIKDTAQLLVFIRGITDDFQIFEELASICPMKGRTTGEEIAKEVISSINKLNLSWDKLAGICTDGAPSMVGKNIGAAVLIEKHCKKYVRKYHCIIHQQALCSKILPYKHVISTVVHIVNYIRSKGLKHRAFQSFLEEIGAEYGDLIYHTDVRWLSCGNVLLRFVALEAEIIEFLKHNDKVFNELEDEGWKADLYFITDIMGHINKLNKTLQGKNLEVFELYNEVKCFCFKLHLFHSQLLKADFAHFHTCQEKIPLDKQILYSNKFADSISMLKEEFESRFNLPNEDRTLFKLIEDPFSVDPSELPADFQLEIIDLQFSSLYKGKHREGNLYEFYKILDKNKFAKLIDTATEILCLFGSTYICEQTFSIMNINKNKYRSKLSDEHLRDILRTSTSKLIPKPNICLPLKSTAPRHF